ncbi:MAG: hypothetical protein ACK2TW_06465 [Anaerolineales bacterium]|jgi:hypothetical protein
MKAEGPYNQNTKLKFILILATLLILPTIATSCESIGLQPFSQTSELSLPPESGEITAPNIWIEFPVDGSEFPLEPITIVVYATGVNGVNRINLSANGQTIPVGPMQSLNTAGNLVRIDSLWIPPTEGEYIIQANSESGGSSSVRFCVGSCQPETEMPEPTKTTTITPTASTTPGTETPTVTVSPTTDTSQELYIEFYVDPAYIDAGGCSDVIWYVEGGLGTYLDGSFVADSGTQTVCPCETTTYNLSVEKPDQEFLDSWATLEVYGSCEVETEEPEPPPDTEGPSISSPSLVWEGCDVYLQATISDPGGVSWAKYYYNLNGEGWRSIWMSDIGSDTWISDAGAPVSSGIETLIGTIQYYVEAGDNFGNVSQSPSSSHDITGCG